MTISRVDGLTTTDYSTSTVRVGTTDDRRYRSRMGIHVRFTMPLLSSSRKHHNNSVSCSDVFLSSRLSRYK